MQVTYRISDKCLVNWNIKFQYTLYIYQAYMSQKAGQILNEARLFFK